MYLQICCSFRQISNLIDWVSKFSSYLDTYLRWPWLFSYWISHDRLNYATVTTLTSQGTKKQRYIYSAWPRCRSDLIWEKVLCQFYSVIHADKTTIFLLWYGGLNTDFFLKFLPVSSLTFHWPENVMWPQLNSKGMPWRNKNWSMWCSHSDSGTWLPAPSLPMSSHCLNPVDSAS